MSPGGGQGLADPGILDLQQRRFHDAIPEKIWKIILKVWVTISCDLQ